MKRLFLAGLLLLQGLVHARDPFSASPQSIAPWCTVQGIIVAKNPSACICLYDKHYCVKEGQMIAGYTVAVIAKDAVELTRGNERFVIAVMP